VTAAENCTRPCIWPAAAGPQRQGTSGVSHGMAAYAPPTGRYCATRIFHGLYRRTATRENPLHIYRLNPSPFFQTRVFKRVRGGKPGVIDQYVETFVFPENKVHGIFPTLFVSDILYQPESSPARGFDLANNAVYTIGIDIADGHLCTLPGKPPGGSFTNTARGAGNQRKLVGKSHTRFNGDSMFATGLSAASECCGYLNFRHLRFEPAQNESVRNIDGFVPDFVNAWIRRQIDSGSRTRRCEDGSPASSGLHSMLRHSEQPGCRLS